MISLLFALVCGFAALVHSMKVQRVTLLDWALLAIGGLYGIGWVLVLHVTAAGGNPGWAQWILPFQDYYLVHNLSAFLLLGGIFIGWYLVPPIWRVKFLPNTDIAVRRPDRWPRVLWALLILAVTLQGVYTHSYGGFLGVLEYSALIRSGLFNAVPPNPFSFLRPFGGLAMIAALGFFGLLLSRNRSLSVRLGFVLSFLFSLYILYSWLGRMAFMVFLVSFPLTLAMYRSSSPFWLMAKGGLAFIGTLVGAYGMSVLLNLKPAENLLEFLAKELSYPFASFFAQLAYGEHLFRGFVDFLWAPVFLLPSSWWTHWLEPVGQVNTAVIMGAPKGERGVTGTIPVDLLTLGLMQLHIPGIILTGALFGALLRIVQAFLDRISCRGVRVAFEANLALQLAVLGAFYSEPELIISGNIRWIAAALIAFVLLRLPNLRVRLLPRHAHRGVVS